MNDGDQLMNARTRFLCTCLLVSAVIGLVHAPRAVAGQTLSGQALVTALREGGFVIVMRHASSPEQPPDKEHVRPENVNGERQLDDVGRSTAAAMGRAFGDLGIPVGVVFSSPAFRARETARLAQWTNVVPSPELGDNGQGMARVVPADQTAWLQQRVTLRPRGTNTILVTHLPNISRAFPASSAGLTDGEALIFSPDGKGGAAVVARVKIDEWPRLGSR
ncbi:MAG TPA: histidine phosphatase family protein [Gemmataceae bacterium]|nr:histidine phosphatase family protein [Gemmataceae bacterium]